MDSGLDTVLAGLPAVDRHAEQLPDLYHTVARGDTLSAIAVTYGTRVATLVALNALDSRHRIRAGQRLRLPAAGPAPAAVAVAVEAGGPSAVEAPADEAAAVEEMTPAAMSDDAAVAAAPAAVDTALLSDPSDYSVAANGSIEVQPLETLGHFGDWLEIRTQRLRDINGLAFRTPVARRSAHSPRPVGR